jgi:dTMP kinase
MVIEFSGLDCAGKSTQIELLQRYYEGKGYRVKVIWSRGGYTPGITWLKGIIRGGNRKPQEMTAEERQVKVTGKPKGGRLLLWLSIVDLVFYWGIFFRLSNRKSTMIFCDRYFWDTYIDFRIKYPHVRFDKWPVWKLLSALYKKPDCSFVLTITPEESMSRSELKFEPFPETEERRVSRLGMYMDEIKSERWQYVIDCMRPIGDIHKELKELIDENIDNA